MEKKPKKINVVHVTSDARIASNAGTQKLKSCCGKISMTITQWHKYHESRGAMDCKECKLAFLQEIADGLGIDIKIK